MNLVEAGLYYLKRGMSVIPFKRDKSKACIKWEQYQKSYPSPDDVEGWFQKRFSNEFIAIVTGKISKLMVVDCDTQEAYQNVQELLPDGFTTPTAKSPHGWHLYFKFKEGLVNRAAYMPGVDVRTEGGCIIAPPSINGDGIGYNWLSGLSLEKNDLQEMPSLLFNTLLQFVYNNARARITDYELSTTDYTDDKCLQYFTEGRRNQDIFHVANSLTKGRCDKNITKQVLKFIAQNCTPPYHESEIENILKSAEGRQNVKDRNLAGEIREWVLSTNGDFLSTSIYTDLQLSTRDERKNVSIILKRLEEKEKLIEKSGDRNGQYRLRDTECQPVNWLECDSSYKELLLPLGLGEICGVQPGNILVFAGAKDSGKTAFMMNIAKENRHIYKVHYFNSEMGSAEYKMRVSKFDDISLKQFYESTKMYPVSSNFHDKIKPGEENLNIIDYLEVPDEVWRVGSMIKKIHDRLDGALCVIAIQKKIGQDLGRGAEFSMEKSRLYVSLDYSKAKIISCKNFKENEIIKGNPRGYSCRYKLVNGCKIIKQPPGWANAEKEDA